MNGADWRVRDTQREVRPTLAAAVAFAAAAVIAAVAPHDTGIWLPLHLFLVGSLLLAISGASVLFAVTWSAAAAPAHRLVVLQRTLLALGAAGVAMARELAWPDTVMVTAAGAVVAALVLLAAMLVTTVAAGRNRRFDAPVGNYVLALAAGVVGCSMGALLAVEPRSAGFLAGHEAVNLLGLVGIVIAATLPFFSATEARTKMSARATASRQRLLGGTVAVSLIVAVVGLLGDTAPLAGVGLAGYVVGLGLLVVLLPRLRVNQFRWAGPRLVGLLLGIAWWASAVTASSAHAFAGREVFTRSVLMALVVGGYAQILLSSLAYLGPVLRGGGHEVLTSGFRTTRSWVTLGAVNAAAVLLVAGVTAVGWALLTIAVADTVARAARLYAIPRVQTSDAPRAVS